MLNNEAVVVLPAVRHGAVRDAGLRRWLGRGDYGCTEEPLEVLDRVAAALELDAPVEGRGALRLWGQTGERAAVWMAAADPVYLEARLDHLCLHRVTPQEIPSNQLGQLFDELQAELGDDDALGFIQLGHHGYLRARTPMPTAVLSSAALHAREPSPWMPTGEDARRYHRLHSEIQMALHLARDNRDREDQGLRPINALWLWGGGVAPEANPRPLPVLFAEDALLRGYWHTARGSVFDWPGGIADCAEVAPTGFVAVAPFVLRQAAEGPDALSAHLTELRTLLSDGGFQSLQLLFADGVTIRLRRRHAFRFWRGAPASLEQAVTS